MQELVSLQSEDEVGTHLEAFNALSFCFEVENYNLERNSRGDRDEGSCSVQLGDIFFVKDAPKVD